MMLVNLQGVCWVIQRLESKWVWQLDWYLILLQPGGLLLLLLIRVFLPAAAQSV